MKSLICTLLLLPLVSLAEQLPLASWVQVGPQGVNSVRVVTEADSCPTLEVDHKLQPMQLRVGPEAPAFANRVCEYSVPASAKQVTLNGKQLPLFKLTALTQFVITGDSGCRLSVLQTQACHDPAAWPFAAINHSITKRHPQLYLHVGDYVYRAVACSDPKRCGESTAGDNWRTWQADFFAPSKDVRSQVPMLLVRGNHESCLRMGKGWQRYLSAWPYPKDGQCVDYEAPYSVPTADLTLQVIDNSFEAGIFNKEKRAHYLAQALDFIRQHANTNNWVLAHQGYFCFYSRQYDPDTKTDYESSPLGKGAEDFAFPDTTQLIVSGHAHDFQALTLATTLPAQVIVGTGGTLLDQSKITDLAGVKLSGGEIKQGSLNDQFGFLTLTRDPKHTQQWTGQFYDPRNHLLAKCLLRDRMLSCH